MSSLFASAAFKPRMYSSRVGFIATNSFYPLVNGSRPFFVAMTSATKRHDAHFHSAEKRKIPSRASHGWGFLSMLVEPFLTRLR